jgi:hypothetical protein
MRQQHPDDRGALTDQERSEFREIWKTLADGEVGHAPADAEDVGEPRPGLSSVVILCVVLVLIGLAANSGFLIVVASGAGLWAYVARRRLHATEGGRG